MNILESHLTFVGTDEKTGKPRCGFLTDLIDAHDMPVSAGLAGATLSLTAQTGIMIEFELPDALVVYISHGADFWIANIGGTEDAWLITIEQH
jgi:hypothetical protein